MNIIDIFLILIILLSIWNGFQRGFITGMAELIGMLATLYVVFLFYPTLAHFIERHDGSAGIVSFGVALMVSILVVRLLFAMIVRYAMSGVPDRAFNHTANNILGIFPGFINGFIYAVLMSGLLFMVPFSPYISAKTADSKLGNKFSNVLDSLERKIPGGIMDSVHNSMSKMHVATGSTEFVKLSYVVTNPTARPNLEAEMLIMVNKERAKAGLKPVVADPELTEVARKHSKDMFARGYFSHYSPEKASLFDRMREGNISYSMAGENLALAPTLQMAHKGLMESPGHRANIMRPGFGRLGIGILDGGRYGLMVTQNFRD
ncbi:MAG TPA: hypothetical protein DIT07_06185 [Sphingobacteriaceae bacterium]|nr:hypothetical protein [Sphingobacteriaceae bacterium]